MIRPMHQQYIVKGGGSLPDPATYCPTNGYIDPTLPNNDWLILPRTTVKYGLLYNGWAINNAKKITSIGYSVASTADFQALSTYLGGNTISGGKLKETGTTCWNTPNSGASNEVGFNARGSGYHLYSGGFSNINLSSNFGTSSVSGSMLNTCIIHNSDTIFDITSNRWTSFVVGLSVRVIKDLTTLSNGETGFYVDPSGYVYRTICINGKEWVADNIKTQHYRDGTIIPEVTSDVAWTALTTGALCAYNNDWSNV